MTANLTNGSASLLPAAFAHLDPFVAKWALHDAGQRADMRARTSIDELRRFYNAMLPVAADAAESLRGTPIEDLDERQVTLLKVLLSLVDVAVGVECFNSGTVPYGYDQARLLVVPVANMTPAF